MANISITDRTYCITLPPKISSRSILVPGYQKNHVLQYGLPQLELKMITIFAFTQICYFILKPFRLPAFVPQLLARPCWGRNQVFRKTLFPEFNEEESHALEISDALEIIGLSMFLFLTGVKMDMNMLMRVGQKSWVVAATTLIFPLIVGGATLAIHSVLHRPAKEDMALLNYIFLQLSFTNFPVISCLLSDLKLLNSELGRLALSSSLVSHIFQIFISFALSSASLTLLMAYKNIFLISAFLLLIAFVFRPAMKWIIKQTPKGRPVKEIYLHGIVFLVFTSALFTKSAGQTILIGPFILGLAVPDGPQLGTVLVNRLGSFFSGILLPIYVTVSVAKANLGDLASRPHMIPLEIVLILIVFLSKLLGSILPPLICKMPLKDSLALALILSSDGIVELGSYRFLYDQKVLISSSLTPILVRKLFDSSRKIRGYQTRNVMHLKPDMGLPVVTCIHRSDDIATTIGVLSYLNPSRQSPIEVIAIHLIKLVGQATPVLISHQQQRKIVGKSYSDEVILAFTNYAQNNMGAVDVNIFTAISPAKLMYEDVCHIALDKLSSLIILPYHCRWSNGKVESRDSHIRTLNVAILQRAPCLVGILVDRGHLAQGAEINPNFHVGVFYIGGEDDMEALALARRMARDPGLVLTVVHLCEKSDDEEGAAGSLRLDEVMNDEVLRGVKMNEAGRNVRYRREMVHDGPETALLVRTMANEFDLVMVGRRYGMECTQTSGLAHWIEVSELGVLGDLLASPDLHTDSSVLVIQQQHK
ncbi:hypothetical protein SAY86_018613 [Trapa natans]|uniref:Cation/H+ exchanger domain-containing protein n=1 Tax=Trapa natans TaxID=22666 RepID=A0AAN7LFB3_TRANT|nr:hypothetical protein SAY86_018613 [Trapa natans]